MQKWQQIKVQYVVMMIKDQTQRRDIKEKISHVIEETNWMLICMQQYMKIDMVDHTRSAWPPSFPLNVGYNEPILLHGRVIMSTEVWVCTR